MKQRECKGIIHQIKLIRQTEQENIITVTIQIPMKLGWIERVKFYVGTKEEEKHFSMEHWKDNENNCFFTAQIKLPKLAVYYYYFSFEANGEFQYYKEKNNQRNNSIAQDEKWKLITNFHRITQVKTTEEGGSFEVEVQIPMELGWIKRVTFFVGNNGQESVISMKHLKNEGEYAFFTTKVNLATNALYYYYFSFEVNREIYYLKKEDITSDKSISPQEKWKMDVNFYVPDWAKGGMMYHIFVDRFKRSGEISMEPMPRRIIHEDWEEKPIIGPADDDGRWNIDFYGGNLKGIQKSLKYIKKLGVTILYLSPIVYSQSNHRYDTSDYEIVDPYLGCNEDLKDLCKAAHKMDIRIVLDAVFNHTGDDSKYFNRYGTFNTVGAYQSEKSPYTSFYKKRWDKGVKSFSYWWDFLTLPECDGNSEAWINYICGVGGIIDQWFAFGIDGLRLDVADELTDNYISQIWIAMKRNKTDALLLGEVWKNFMRMNRNYVSSAKGMHSTMNYPLADALIRYFKYTDVAKLDSVIQEIMTEYPTKSIQTLMNFISTHDISRLIEILGCNCFQKSSEWSWNLINDSLDWLCGHKMTREERWYGKKTLKTYVFALSFFPGTLSIFYGDEVGLEGIGNLLNRAPYPWGKRDKDLLKFFRKMGKIREKLTFLKTAEYRTLEITSEYWMYERYDIKERVLVVVSRTHHEVPIAVPIEYQKGNVVAQLYNSTKDKLTPYGAIAIKV